jgi:hypothetical protein
MTPVSGDAPAPRWRTLLFDSLGWVAVIWSIPIAIVVIGAPIALLVKLVQLLARTF